jgi:hypothetical protein
MRNSYLNLVPKIQLGFISMAFIYFLISLCYFVFLSSVGGGDESLFIKDLIFIKTEGWFVAIEKGISIPYMLLVYPFSFFFKEYLAGRIVTLFLLIVLLFYYYKIVKIKAFYFYGYLFFFLGTSHYFFVGTNDALFFLGIVVFITEVYSFLENKKMNSQTLAFSGLVVSFFTRELVLVYLPILLLSIYFLYKEGFYFFNKKMIVPVLLFVVFIVFNIPSLSSKGKLSYDDKTPSSTVHVSWVQRQYLAQLLVNKGELRNFQHPSWEQTEDYLKKNGLGSLPNGIVECMSFDYSLTFKEFFKDFYYSMFFGFRQLGLILLFPFYFIVINFKKENILNRALYLPYSLICMLSVLSLIIISYIEARWYIAIFIVTIVFYNEHQMHKRINDNFIILNYLVLTFFSLYGIYSLLYRFIGD